MVEEEFSGELSKISPRRIVRLDKNEIDDFFLVLALVYNDLKGLISLESSFREKYRLPPEGEISAHSGSYNGQTLQIHRLYAGLVHEFLTFLKSNEGIFTKYEFEKDILGRVPSEWRSRWIEILDIALDKTESESASNFAKVIRNIRNNISYHYYQAYKNLRVGFSKFFFDTQKISSNEFAFYSLGENMETTRFYYIDAAVQEYLKSESGKKEGSSSAEDLKKHVLDIREMMETMNFTIFFLLKGYIKSRPHHE